MSWATCFSGCNNTHFNYPPIMADGRNYASWQPDAVINRRIQKKENIHSNWTYRQFLQQNGLEIMKFNSEQACYDLGLPCHQQVNTTPSSNVPYRYASTFDTSSPGFGYCNSDLKNPYLSREQLNARLISPSISVPVVNGLTNIKRN
jgi:hypothetical protein